MTTVGAERIAASNVRPAFEASLHHGATEAELEAATGLTRAALADDTATVSAEVTYLHMELMFQKPNFAHFVVEAARAHTLSSLGVVGLACKTVATLREAIRCHHRYQHLTNRTARYESSIQGDRFVLGERRFGPLRLGNQLISDYTMLVAIHLIRDTASEPVPVIEMHSRREALEGPEREIYEAFVGAPIIDGAPRASMSLPASVLDQRVASADPELCRYFQGVLAQATHFEPDEAPILTTVRRSIRDALIQGAPTAEQVARALALSRRSLQRRLAEHGQTFAELLESTRRTLARGYLGDPALSLAEITFLLGYREQSSFFRAFKRWYGQTPAAYRLGLVTERGTPSAPVPAPAPAGVSTPAGAAAAASTGGPEDTSERGLP